jgi:hypothetical protein
MWELPQSYRAITRRQSFRFVIMFSIRWCFLYRGLSEGGFDFGRFFDGRLVAILCSVRQLDENGQDDCCRHIQHAALSSGYILFARHGGVKQGCCSSMILEICSVNHQMF